MSEFVVITTMEAMDLLRLKRTAFDELMKETGTKPFRRNRWIKKQVELAAFRTQRLAEAK